MTTIFSSKCKLCGNKFIAKKSGFYEKRFCSEICRTRYNSKVYYDQFKDTIEYKKKNYNRLKKWIKHNRKHFTDLCRVNAKVYRKKKYAINDKLGLCVMCGKERDNPRKRMMPGIKLGFTKACIKCTQLKEKSKVRGRK